MSLVENYPLVLTASAVNLLYYLYTALSVGSARVKYGVKAPAVTGHLEFEKAYRVQMNGLEYLPVAMSSLWMAALTSQNDALAGGLGLTYAIGRVAFGLGYPDKRSAGFGISFLSIVGLLGIAGYHAFGGVFKKYL